MRNRKQLVWRIADLAESYCTDLEPQHILISGAEGSGKTFIIEKLAEELAASGFLMVKYLYPHSNIVGTESLIKDLDYLLGKKAVVLIDDFDKLLLSMTKGEQKKWIAISIFNLSTLVLDNTLQRLYFAGLWIVNSAKEWVQALYKVRNWVQNGCNFEM